MKCTRCGEPLTESEVRALKEVARHFGDPPEPICDECDLMGGEGQMDEAHSDADPGL